MTKLSDSELIIMDVIWRKGKTTSPEIIKSLTKQYWNHNTIRTFIKRLLNKKAIKVSEKKGKTNFYEPNIDKDEYIREMKNDFLKKYEMLTK